MNEDLELCGGLGLYFGGNLNVWILNVYLNDGVINIGVCEGDIIGWILGVIFLFDVFFIGEGCLIFDIL